MGFGEENGANTCAPVVLTWEVLFSTAFFLFLFTYQVTLALLTACVPACEVSGEAMGFMLLLVCCGDQTPGAAPWSSVRRGVCDEQQV